MDWTVVREHARVAVALAILTWLSVEVIAHFAPKALG